MRTIRFYSYGEPEEVLKQEEAPIPQPGVEQIRIRVHACGLNPADWALCRGLFSGLLPRGVGLDVSGTVEAIGESVTSLAVGDWVLGVPDYADCTSAGLADQAILKHWAPMPEGLDPVQAAALPMVIETAYRSIEQIGVKEGGTLLVNGAGTMIGYGAVQMGLLRGARVIATAGETFAGKLRALGAEVTTYGEGMVERVREISPEAPDWVLDTAPPNGALPALIEIAGGNARRVLTITDPAAKELGARMSFEEGVSMAYDQLGPFAELAAAGKFEVPVAQTFAFEEWREAMAASMSWKARGKLVVLTGGK